MSFGHTIGGRIFKMGDVGCSHNRIVNLLSLGVGHLVLIDILVDVVGCGTGGGVIHYTRLPFKFPDYLISGSIVDVNAVAVVVSIFMFTLHKLNGDFCSISVFFFSFI